MAMFNSYVGLPEGSRCQARISEMCEFGSLKIAPEVGALRGLNLTSINSVQTDDESLGLIGLTLVVQQNSSK